MIAERPYHVTMIKPPRGIHAELLTATSHESRVLVDHPHGSNELWLTSDGELATDMTHWLPLLMPVAMGMNVPLHLHGPVDKTALEGANQAQEVLHGWYPTKNNGWYPIALNQVTVEADEITPAAAAADGSAVLFSGGVDAFHSAMRHDSSHLLFIHGFDIPLTRTWLIEKAGRELRAAADEMGRTLVQAATNVRELANPWADWGYQYHGAATAGVAMAHSSLWGSAVIASSHSPEERHPWASHPDLDSLWSSSRVRVIHDAAEWERTEKMAEIADWPVAMRHLRVCWQNFDDKYNCGRCEKCVRTMVNLHMIGALDRCATLPHDLTRERIVRSGITGADARGHARTNVRLLEERGEHALASAVKAGIRRGYLEEAYIRTRDAVPPQWRAALRRVRGRS